MKRTIVILIFLAAAIAAAYFAWRWTQASSDNGVLTLYGNVDLRQADLAFNDSERISKVLAQEGDHVQKGQLLAELETNRLEPQLAAAQAAADAQQQVVNRLHNGSRPEDIAEARANLDSAQADLANARQNFDRMTSLQQNSAGRAVTQQDMDNVRASLDVAQARVVADQKALDLEVIGPRKEDIAQAEAQLQGEEAQVALARQQLADAKLIAPQDGIIRSRLMEPGEMASPQKPVFSVAIVDPKWVRAYVPEEDLGKLHPGMTAAVTVDSFPGRKFDGWVGFISPVAEFTPKSVETPELRTSLVYEVRVFVKDPSDDLRLGMPATVTFPPAQPATQP